MTQTVPPGSDFLNLNRVRQFSYFCFQQFTASCMSELKLRSQLCSSEKYQRFNFSLNCIHNIIIQTNIYLFIPHAQFCTYHLMNKYNYELEKISYREWPSHSDNTSVINCIECFNQNRTENITKAFHLPNENGAHPYTFRTSITSRHLHTIIQFMQCCAAVVMCAAVV